MCACVCVCVCVCVTVDLSRPLSVTFHRGQFLINVCVNLQLDSVKHTFKKK